MATRVALREMLDSLYVPAGPGAQQGDERSATDMEILAKDSSGATRTYCTMHPTCRVRSGS